MFGHVDAPGFLPPAGRVSDFKSFRETIKLRTRIVQNAIGLKLNADFNVSVKTFYNLLNNLPGVQNALRLRTIRVCNNR